MPPLPPQLAGATLLVNGVAAPLFFASASQINFQVPFGLTGPVAELRIRNATGEAAMHVPLGTAAPGIIKAAGLEAYCTEAARWSRSPIRATREKNWSCLRPDWERWISGCKRCLQAPFSPVAQTPNQPTVRVGGATAETRFSGLAPGFVGLYQVNFVVPSGLSGAVKLTLDMGGITSNVVSIFVTP